MAVFELVGDSASQLSDKAAADADALVDSLDLSIETKDMSVDQKFLDRPEDLAIVELYCDCGYPRVQKNRAETCSSGP